jgi:hypothetical protein
MKLRNCPGGRVRNSRRAKGKGTKLKGKGSSLE